MLEKLKKLTYGARMLLSGNEAKTETVDVAGRSIVVKHAGSGPTFVYLHSTLDESMLWFPFYHAWAKEFRVIVPTHPGFGSSTGFDQIDTIEDMAFHYVELFDALGLDEVILGGVSLGGWIAAEFAVRWPERVKKLWLSGAPGLWVDSAPPGNLFRVMQDRQALRALNFHEPDSATARMVIGDHGSEAQMMAAYQSLTVLARLSWQRPYDPKLAARLHRIKCPVLLAWAEQDRLVPIAHGEEYRKYLPQAEWKPIAQSGHLVMFEREKEFVETVASFCRRL